MAAKLYTKPTRKAVAELMLAMEIERRRKASLELDKRENKSEVSIEENFNNSRAEERSSQYDHFDARTILLDMMETNKRSKLDPDLVAEYKKTPTGDTENIVDSLAEYESDTKSDTDKTAPANHPPDSEKRRLSNCMRDGVRSICQICRRSETWNNMRSHTKNVHGIRITDYKQQYGQLINTVVEKVFHKCGLCARVLLLDPDVIKQHLGNYHRISLKQYSAKYMTKRGFNEGVIHKG